MRTTPPNNIPLQRNYVSYYVYHIHLIKEQINYLYAACFSPAIFTFIKAIKAGYFTNFPNLTTELVTTYLTKNIASAKGHLDQQYKNCRSNSKIKTTSNTVENKYYSDDFALL